MITPRFVTCTKHHADYGNVKEYTWDANKIFVEQSLSDDLLMLQNAFEGKIISSHIYPLIYDSKCEIKEISLRSLEFYREVKQNYNKFYNLSPNEKLYFMIGLRDLFVASSRDLLNEEENELLSTILDPMDPERVEIIEKNVDFLWGTPFPTPKNKIAKFVSSNTETDVDRFFIRNELGLLLIFVDPGDLSYHNFENIINLDSLFTDIQENFSIYNFKRFSDNKEVYSFDLRDEASLLLSLDKYGFYTPPFNKLSRGGQRFIFSSQRLSQSLTIAIKRWHTIRKFKFVNYVFRYNKFKPNDKKFASHYDTPYHDPRRRHYSRYTLLLYLTPGVGDPVLSLNEGQIKIDKIESEEGIKGFIFDQKYEHEGKSFLDTDKIFLRSELIFEYEEGELDFRSYVSKQFNIACYMTKQSVFNNELEEYASQCFNQAAETRLNVINQNPKVSEDLLLYKEYNKVGFLTNGYDYWFTNDVTLIDASIYVVLDYFNCKFDSKDHFNKLTYNKVIRLKTKNMNKIFGFLQKKSNKGPRLRRLITMKEKSKGVKILTFNSSKNSKLERLMKKGRKMPNQFKYSYLKINKTNEDENANEDEFEASLTENEINQDYEYENESKSLTEEDDQFESEYKKVLELAVENEQNKKIKDEEECKDEEEEEVSSDEDKNWIELENKYNFKNSNEEFTNGRDEDRRKFTSYKQSPNGYSHKDNGNNSFENKNPQIENRSIHYPNQLFVSEPHEFGLGDFFKNDEHYQNYFHQHNPTLQARRNKTSEQKKLPLFDTQDGKILISELMKYTDKVYEIIKPRIQKKLKILRDQNFNLNQEQQISCSETQGKPNFDLKEIDDEKKNGTDLSSLMIIEDLMNDFSSPCLNKLEIKEQNTSNLENNKIGQFNNLNSNQSVGQSFDLEKKNGFFNTREIDVFDIDLDSKRNCDQIINLENQKEFISEPVEVRLENFYAKERDNPNYFPLNSEELIVQNQNHLNQNDKQEFGIECSESEMKNIINDQFEIFKNNRNQNLKLETHEGFEKNVNKSIQIESFSEAIQNHNKMEEIIEEDCKPYQYENFQKSSEGNFQGLNIPQAKEHTVEKDDDRGFEESSYFKESIEEDRLQSDYEYVSEEKFKDESVNESGKGENDEYESGFEEKFFEFERFTSEENSEEEDSYRDAYQDYEDCCSSEDDLEENQDDSENEDGDNNEFKSDQSQISEEDEKTSLTSSSYNSYSDDEGSQHAKHCCPNHHPRSFNPFKNKKVSLALGNEYLTKKFEMNALRFRFPILIFNKRIFINKSRIKMTDKLIIFGKKIPSVNFAACSSDSCWGGNWVWGDNLSPYDFVSRKKQEANWYKNIPPIPYKVYANGYHLKIELFNNKFVRRRTEPVFHPVITKKPKVYDNRYGKWLTASKNEEEVSEETTSYKTPEDIFNQDRYLYSDEESGIGKEGDSDEESSFEASFFEEY